jgi:hypothetical protein
MAWFQGDQIRILKIASKPLDFETGGITAMKMAHVRTINQRLITTNRFFPRPSYP